MTVGLSVCFFIYFGAISQPLNSLTSSRTCAFYYHNYTDVEPEVPGGSVICSKRASQGAEVRTQQVFPSHLKGSLSHQFCFRQLCATGLTSDSARQHFQSVSMAPNRPQIYQTQKSPQPSITRPPGVHRRNQIHHLTERKRSMLGKHEANESASMVVCHRHPESSIQANS